MDSNVVPPDDTPPKVCTICPGLWKDLTFLGLDVSFLVTLLME
jgi:hypothetical protein